MLWYHKTDSYKWINGSIRQDLKPDERSIWADFMALAGLTREPRRGYIERSEGIPYPKQVLLVMLNVPEELFDRAIKKCVQEGRLKVYPDGTMFLTNWASYNDTTDFEEKKAQRAIATEKARQTRQSLNNIVLSTTRAINELNKRLGKARYSINKEGQIVDTATGEIKALVEIQHIGKRQSGND